MGGAGWIAVQASAISIAYGFLLGNVNLPSWWVVTGPTTVRSSPPRFYLSNKNNIDLLAVDEDGGNQFDAPPVPPPFPPPPPPRRKGKPLGAQAINSLLVQDADNAERLLEIIDENLSGFNAVNCATALDR